MGRRKSRSNERYGHGKSHSQSHSQSQSRSPVKVEELEEEDNNPFVGTTHMYASGITGVLGNDEHGGDREGEAEGEDEALPVLRGVEEDDDDSNENSDIKEEDVDILTQTLYRSADEPFVSVPVKSMTVSGESMFKIPADNEGPITISDAGDYRDPWGKHAIGYVIELNGIHTTRRYSEFHSLRKNLVLLLPTIVVPALPPKHSIMNYIFKKKSVDTRIIDSRKRMLSTFLNDCYDIPEIANHIVFKKFLDNEVLWKDVLNSAPIIILPHDNHLAPPLNPTKPSPLHLILPSPNAKLSRNVSVLNPLIPTNAELENKFNNLEKRFWEHKVNYRNLHKSVKQLENHLKMIGGLFSELGVHYNSFSLENNVKPTNDEDEVLDKKTSVVIEKVGHACDVSYVTHEILSEQLVINLEEPLYEFIQLLEDSRRVMSFRKAKYLQYEIVEITIDKNRKRQKSLKEIDSHTKNMTDVMNQSIVLEARKVSSFDDMHSTVSRVSYPTSDEIQDITGRTTQTGSNEDANDGDVNNESLLSNEAEDNISHVTVNDGETISVEEATQRLSASTIHANKLKVRKELAKRRDRNSRQLDPTLLTESERMQELKILERELDKLEEVQKLIMRDIEDVNNSTLTNLEHVASKLDIKWKILLRKVSKAMVDYSRESLAAWKLLKEHQS
ncbi:Sorting nexin-41 [Nakaseomyces bracarensis]|uniref:Sorting nexin-41 n=1 Tax=Nakaseomyces bracarensis TaxID=273131 RepID=A0ABR4NTT4_9SACH